MQFHRHSRVGGNPETYSPAQRAAIFFADHCSKQEYVQPFGLEDTTVGMRRCAALPSYATHAHNRCVEVDYQPLVCRNDAVKIAPVAT
jgi:hypothetical protein